ncbi:hypothetical protein [Methanoregula sp.]|uniref:cupredoxin domain-containing protein n=1 Tax=Methanoregula sp. TaxID=2052170 RepID=UPI002C1E502C|nr:hypothetical protein [Methanoregula sp.]HVP96512.1 hypothetical protein [Methanoregula sp.]
MKLLMGFIILLVALVAVTGCTQTASPSAQTTVATTVPTTEVTTAATPVATMAETTAPATNETVMANVTAPAANMTTAAVTTTAAPVNVTATMTPATGITTIRFTSAGFVPQSDIVLTGTSVSFVNADNVTHSIMTIGNNTGMFNSGALIPGGAFPYTFSQSSGSFVVALADNQSITGTIIVQEPSGVTSYNHA